MTPNTTLEAVNIMLGAIGETPVNSLTSGLIEAEQAETLLAQVSRSVQTEGWSFNRVKDVVLTHSTNGEVAIGADVLSIDSKYEANADDLVQRGLKLYDRKNRTFNIGKSIKAEVVYELPFGDLPAIARTYIALKAARTFQDQIVGADYLHGVQRRDEEEALLRLRAVEAETEDNNLFNNYDVYRVIDRGIYGV